MSCGFCFNRGLPGSSEISIDSFERLTYKIADIGVREIDILGGEPTLHPDIVRLVGIATSAGLRLNLSTNGTNVPLLERLSGTYNRDTVRIGISINNDLITEELENYIAVYRPVIKSICKRTGLPANAVRLIGSSETTFYSLYMDAVSRKDLGGSMPFPVFYKLLSELRHKYPNADGVYCGGFLPDIEGRPFLKDVRCPAGTTKLSVLPDGSVYPCYLFFRHDEFRLGNIITDKFEDIWNSPALNYFRTFHGNKCSNTSCELFSTCHGGCPAISLLISGDIDAPDPRCVRPRQTNRISCFWSYPYRL